MRPLIARVAVLGIVATASALLHARQGNVAARLTGDARHGQVLVEARCAACHGPDGNGGASTTPRLAGQDAGYLYRQLTVFRDGNRVSLTMGAVASAMSDRDMRDASAFLAGQARQGDRAGDAGLQAEGLALFQQGSADGRVTACVACHDASRGWLAGGMGGMHGMRGSGMSMMMGMSGRNGPRLLGQRAAYVEQRLQGFVDGTPEAARMSAIAASMTARQKRAVAAYVAAHP